MNKCKARYRFDWNLLKWKLQLNSDQYARDLAWLKYGNDLYIVRRNPGMVYSLYA